MGLFPRDPHKGPWSIDLSHSFYQNPFDVYRCLPVLSVLLGYIFFNINMILPDCLANDLKGVLSLVGQSKSLCQKHIFVKYQYFYLTLTCPHLSLVRMEA